MDGVTLVGYSQHALVVADILASQGQVIDAYCEAKEKSWNPLGLRYLGNERSETVWSKLIGHRWIASIGDNRAREAVSTFLGSKGVQPPVVAVHPESVIGSNVSIKSGVMIGPMVAISANAQIGAGVICNTGSIVEHDCEIAAFAHIASGAVLAGEVKVGRLALIGAGAVVAPRITIGDSSVVGAGAVVVHDVPENVTVVGNPARTLNTNHLC